MTVRAYSSPEGVLARLQEAARHDLGDFMTFEVGPDEDHPDIQNDGMQYGGLRFRASCKLAGKLYGQPFGIDTWQREERALTVERALTARHSSSASLPMALTRSSSTRAMWRAR